MTLQTNDHTAKLLAQRIDAIIAELQALRQQVPASTLSTNLVEKLVGPLGQGA